MELNETRKTYPRWIGLILGLLLPGSAHFLSGRKKAGIVWLLTLMLLSVFSTSISAIPFRFAIAAGLIMNLVLMPLLFIVLIIRSVRAVPRMGFKGWLEFFVILLLINMVFVIVREELTVTSFKTPAQSMYPTLRGTSSTKEQEKTSSYDWLIRGKSYKEFRAKNEGKVEKLRMGPEGILFEVGGVLHHIPGYALASFWPKKELEDGEVMWSGTVYGCDHIMVERFSYLFGEPQRGDVVVFSSDGMDAPNVKSGTTYIKRIVGLPGDRIRISPPYILVNGKPLKEPEIITSFEYENAGLLSHHTDMLELKANEYFVVGDNTGRGRSFDSRFFGPIKRRDIIGRASTIYWPLNRMGPIE